MATPATPTPEDVFDALNTARTAPSKLIPLLEGWRAKFQGKMLCLPSRTRLLTQEGVAAVDEALAFLREAKPVPALKRISPGMSAAARDLVCQHGPSGGTGHTGADGSSPFDRISRHGKWSGSAAENISYGAGTDPLEIVIGWIVDDGVASRGHRTNIFKRELSVIGFAAGPHRDMSFMYAARA